SRFARCSGWRDHPRAAGFRTVPSGVHRSTGLVSSPSWVVTDVFYSSGGVRTTGSARGEGTTDVSAHEPVTEPIDAGPFTAWLDEMSAALRGEADADVPCGTCT